MNGSLTLPPLALAAHYYGLAGLGALRGRRGGTIDITTMRRVL